MTVFFLFVFFITFFSYINDFFTPPPKENLQKSSMVQKLHCSLSNILVNVFNWNDRLDECLFTHISNLIFLTWKLGLYVNINLVIASDKPTYTFKHNYIYGIFVS